MKLYYHPGYDLLGLSLNETFVRVYFHHNARTYMPLVGAWELIGEI